MGNRIIKDKVQETWSGEEDVSNVAQLVAQADKLAALCQEGDIEWDIRKSGIKLEGAVVEPPLKAEAIRRSSKSFKLREVEGWRPRRFSCSLG